MSQSLTGTLLGFGLFAVVAAIVGGGLKAIGMEIGPLKSPFRQALLAVLGLVLISASQYNNLLHILVHPKTIVVGPITLEAGTEKSTALLLPHDGQVDVSLQQVSPDYTGFSGPHGQPGQDGVFVSICGTSAAASCERQQVAQSQSVSKALLAGPASVSVFNFATSPRMTVMLNITAPG
jgi:hypothetical protein